MIQGGEGGFKVEGKGEEERFSRGIDTHLLGGVRVRVSVSTFFFNFFFQLVLDGYRGGKCRISVTCHDS